MDGYLQTGPFLDHLAVIINSVVLIEHIILRLSTGTLIRRRQPGEMTVYLYGRKANSDNEIKIRSNEIKTGWKSYSDHRLGERWEWSTSVTITRQGSFTRSNLDTGQSQNLSSLKRFQHIWGFWTNFFFGFRFFAWNTAKFLTFSIWDSVKGKGNSNQATN